MLFLFSTIFLSAQNQQKDFMSEHPIWATIIILLIIGIPFIWWFIIYRIFPNGMIDYLLWKIIYTKKYEQTYYTEILLSAFPWFVNLNEKQQKVCITKLDYLHRKVNFTVTAEISWHSKNEIYVLAHFIRLILYYKRFNYFGLKQIVILHDDFQLKNFGPDRIMGLTKKSGEVFISWKSTLESLINNTDGFNLLYHQAARALIINIDHHRNNDRTIINRLNHFYSQIPNLKTLLQTQKNQLFTQYAMQRDDLFFANGMELFFEKNKELKSLHPKIYQEIQKMLNYPDHPIA
jgi:Mlc titration factor MtfA (ptsG expression regulator)